MKSSTSVKLQFAMAVGMVLLSVFMTFSYYEFMKNASSDVDKSIIFYAWIFSVFAWLAKAIYDLRRIRKPARIH